MKFTAVLSYVLVALVASAVADPQRGGRQGNGRGGFGGFGGGNNNQGNNGQNNGQNNNNNNNNNNNANNNNNNNNAGNNNANNATDTGNNNANNNANNNGNNNNNNADPQSSTTLDPDVIATGFANDGQGANADPGQVASLTSTNNFINFCLTVNKPITNGQQITTGSCNPAPIGVIAATTNMPSSKFVFPPNGGTVEPNTAFTIQMAINNIETGNFVNAQSNYYSAPQQVNGQGNIIGHTHVVIEKLDSLDQTTVTDPSKFAFFKGINGAAQNGIVTADVTDGLDAGVYRIASINSAANHQPVLVAVAQHGSLDDMAYFTVAAGGNANNNNGNNAANGQNNNNNNNNAANGQNAQNGQQNNNNNGRNRGGRNGGRGRGRALRFSRHA